MALIACSAFACHGGTTDGGTTDAGNDAADTLDGGDGGLDASSDGGLDADAGSGCGLVAVTPPVVSGAGPASLGDADTDGNGILDRDEWGPTMQSPLDSDDDGIEDYKDADDDGDGLLDLYDPARLTPVDPAAWWNPDDPFVLTGASVDEGSGHILDDAAREGDTLHVDYVGPALSCHTVVVFAGTPTAMNVAPASTDTNSFTVDVPTGARGPVFVFDGTRRSGSLEVDIHAASDPVLYAPTSMSVHAGDTLALAGSHLDSVTGVVFGETEVMPTSVTADEVDVVVPDRPVGVDDDVFVRSPSGETNHVMIVVQQDVAASATLPAGVSVPASELRFVGDVSSEAMFDASGAVSVPVSARTPERVTLMREQADGTLTPLLDALAVPGDTTIALDETTTAVADTIDMSQAGLHVHPSSMGDVRTRLAALPEVQALATAIATALGGDPGARGATPVAYKAELETATEAAQASIDAGLADGSLRTPTFPLFPLDAVIAPMAEQYDVLLRQTPAGGNLIAENDTQLFLSVGMIDRETGAILQHHISGYFDAQMVTPQDGLLMAYNASDKEFAHPNFGDAHVQVITPGMASPGAGSALGVAHMLLARTLLERLIMPSLQTALGVKLPAEALMTTLLLQGRATLHDIEMTAATGDPHAVGTVFYTFLKDDYQAGFPILRALVKRIFRDRAPAIFASIAKRIGEKFVPVLGEIDAAIDAIGIADTVTSIGKLFVDLGTTPGSIDFDVTWGIAIDSASPSPLHRSCNPFTTVTLHGVGFAPELVGGTLKLPKITITDLGSGGPDPLTMIDPTFIAPDGQSMDIDLPSDFASQMVGPLKLEVMHRDDTESIRVPVEDMPGIVLINPPTAQPGHPIEIRGHGFDPSAAVFDVSFVERDATGIPRGFTVNTFTSASDTSITMNVPALPMDAPDWDVRVFQGDASCSVASAPHFFSTTGVCIEDLTLVSGGTAGYGDDVDNEGDVLWSASVGGTLTSFVRHNGMVWTLPTGCLGYHLSPTGDVAGLSQPGNSFPAVWMRTADPLDSGTCTALPTRSGSEHGVANAMNSAGVVVGGVSTYPSDTSRERAAMWLGGVLSVLDSSQLVAFDINDAGLILANQASTSYLFSGGVRSEVCPGLYCTTRALNESGEVTGWDNMGMPAVWAGGVETVIGTQGHPAALNDTGAVVGSFYSGSATRPALWLRGPAFGVAAGQYDLNEFLSPMDAGEWLLTSAWAVNDNGLVIGTGTHTGTGLTSSAYLVDLRRCAPSAPPTVIP